VRRRGIAGALSDLELQRMLRRQPSTGSTTPVIYEAASESRKTVVPVNKVL
jgi:hypothetical protein